MNFMNLKDKILAGKATLADQDEALKDPYLSYIYAYYIEGADIEKCQEAVCKEPGWAYWFAYEVKGADIEKCQEVVCKEVRWAYRFACDIPGADIEKIKKLHPQISDDIDEFIMNKALI